MLPYWDNILIQSIYNYKHNVLHSQLSSMIFRPLQTIVVKMAISEKQKKIYKSLKMTYRNFLSIAKNKKTHKLFLNILAIRIVSKQKIFRSS